MACSNITRSWSRFTCVDGPRALSPSRWHLGEVETLSGGLIELPLRCCGDIKWMTDRSAIGSITVQNVGIHDQNRVANACISLGVVQLVQWLLCFMFVQNLRQIKLFMR